MTTGTYLIDATNNFEPLDSRYVADFPAELRAMKTRMNEAISGIGELTGALMSDGTNYMTGRLGVGVAASAGLMFHLYGNARMEGTVTVIGKQDITGSSFVPSNSAVSNAASTVRGSYGGGYVMVDGATYGGTYMQAGELKIGLGTSAGLQAKFTLGQSFHSFEGVATCQVAAYAGSGYAAFSVVSSGTNPAYLFLSNGGGEKGRIIADNASSLIFCSGAAADTLLTLQANRTAVFHGNSIHVGNGAATTGEKRIHLSNEYGSPYLFLSPGGDIGIHDPVVGVSRTRTYPNGDCYTAGSQFIGGTASADWREMRLRNSNRQVALALEGGGSQVHLWDVTGNNALWSINMAGDFTARGIRATDPTKTFGYGAGTGGAVTQPTNKSTGVTLNKPTGRIVTHNESMAPGACKYFSVSNSLVAANSVVCVSADPTTCSAVYNITTYVIDRAFIVLLHNASGVTLTDAIGLNFVVINGAAS